MKKDRSLTNEDGTRQRNVLINHELELEHERTMLVSGPPLLLGLVGRAAYNLARPRRDNRETL